MSWTFGSFLGPVLSGSLVEQAGYYEMCRVLGMLLLLLGSMKIVTDQSSGDLFRFVNQCICELVKTVPSFACEGFLLIKINRRPLGLDLIL